MKRTGMAGWSRAFWIVVRLTLVNTFGLSAARDRYFRRRQRLWEPIVIGVAIAGGGGAFMAVLYHTAYATARAGLLLHQPQLGWVLSILTVQIITLFFGFFMVVSVFYFSDDLARLVPLPIPGSTIVAAKFTAVLVGEYVTAAVIMAPTALAYARVMAGAPTVMGGGPLYWLVSVLVFLLAPVLPLALASLIAVALMRVINRRHRDTLMVVFTLFITAAMLAFQLGIQVKAQDMPPAQAQEYLLKLMSSRLGLVQAAGRYFPPSVWATQAVAAAGTAEGLANLGAVLGVSFIALLAMVAAGERMFFGGLIGAAEVARRRRPVATRLERTTVAASPLGALYLREWRLFMRTPIWVMNGFAGAVIVPIMAVVPVMSGKQLVPNMGSILNTGMGQIYAGLVVAAAIVLVSSLNTVGSTSISREGRHFWISKVLPVRPALQVQAKLLFAAVSVVVAAIPVAATYAIVFKPSSPLLAGATAAGLLGAMVGQAGGLLFDLVRPFWSWTNPQAVVKNNLNALFPMGLDLLLFLALGGPAARAARGGAGAGEVFGVLVTILAVLAVALYLVDVRQAERLYLRLDA